MGERPYRDLLVTLRSSVFILGAMGHNVVMAMIEFDFENIILIAVQRRNGSRAVLKCRGQLGNIGVVQTKDGDNLDQDGGNGNGNQWVRLRDI